MAVFTYKVSPAGGSGDVLGEYGEQVSFLHVVVGQHKGVELLLLVELLGHQCEHSLTFCQGEKMVNIVKSVKFKTDLKSLFSSCSRPFPLPSNVVITMNRISLCFQLFQIAFFLILSCIYFLLSLTFGFGNVDHFLDVRELHHLYVFVPLLRRLGGVGCRTLSVKHLDSTFTHLGGKT